MVSTYRFSRDGKQIKIEMGAYSGLQDRKEEECALFRSVFDLLYHPLANFYGYIFSISPGRDARLLPEDYCLAGVHTPYST